MTVSSTSGSRLALPPVPAALAVGEDGLLPGSSGAPEETSSSATDLGAVSDAGVRYADGAAVYSEQDLSSDGFGLPWGQTRVWTSGVGYASHSLNGAGWVDSNLPYLTQENGTNTLVAVDGGTDARYFDWNGSAYVERFFGQDTLTHDSGNSQYVLDAPDGSQLRFFDFSDSLPVLKRGSFASCTDAYGNAVSATAWNGNAGASASHPQQRAWNLPLRWWSPLLPIGPSGSPASCGKQ